MRAERPTISTRLCLFLIWRPQVRILPGYQLSAGAESCRKKCRFLGHQSLVWCISNGLAMLPIPQHRRNATKVSYSEGAQLRQRQEGRSNLKGCSRSY